MYNSMNDAANAALLDLCTTYDQTPTYSDEVASTLANIAAVYESFLTTEEKAALPDFSGNYNAIADQLGHVLAVANVILAKYVEATAETEDSETPGTT